MNHLNEQWPSYWSALFLQNGFDCFDPIRQRVWLRTEVDWWYSQNVLVFAKGNASVRLGAQVRPVLQPLPLIHPRKYLLQVAIENDLRSGLIAATATPIRSITPLTPKVERLGERRGVASVFRSIGNCDLVIDDGSHIPKHQATSFRGMAVDQTGRVVYHRRPPHLSSQQSRLEAPYTLYSRQYPPCSPNN